MYVYIRIIITLFVVCVCVLACVAVCVYVSAIWIHPAHQTTHPEQSGESPTTSPPAAARSYPPFGRLTSHHTPCPPCDSPSSPFFLDIVSLGQRKVTQHTACVAKSKWKRKGHVYSNPLYRAQRRALFILKGVSARKKKGD